MNMSDNPNTGLPKIGFEDDAAHFVTAGDELEDEALANVLVTLESDNNASVRIYRQGPSGYRDVTFLTECLPSEYSESRLQNEFGGGEFRVHVRSGGRLLANKAIKVAPPINRQQSTPAALLAPVQQQIAQLTDVVAKLAQAVAVAQQPAPTQSRKEFFEEMMLMKTVLGGTPRPERDPLDQLLKLAEVQKMLGGGAGGGDAEPGGMSVLLKALETLGPVLAQSRGQQVQTAGLLEQGLSRTSTSAASGATPAALPQYDVDVGLPATEFKAGTQSFMPPETGTVTPAPATDQETEMLKFYINMLIAEAKQNIDPEAYALLITQKLGRDQIDQLLKPDNWFDMLSAFEPKVIPFREWFSDLREIVFEILSEQGGADTTGETQPGSDNHASAGTTNTNAQGNT